MLKELKNALTAQKQVSVSEATVSRELKEMDLPRKKRLFSPSKEIIASGRGIGAKSKQ
jgi:arginine repressor